LPNDSPPQNLDTILFDIAGSIARANAALRVAEMAAHDLQWGYCSQVERAAIDLVVHDGQGSRHWEALTAGLAEAQEQLGDLALTVDLALYPGLDAAPSGPDDQSTAPEERNGLDPDSPLETNAAAAAWEEARSGVVTANLPAQPEIG
jgi:hypothetical protein